MEKELNFGSDASRAVKEAINSISCNRETTFRVSAVALNAMLRSLEPLGYHQQLRIEGIEGQKPAYNITVLRRANPMRVKEAFQYVLDNTKTGNNMNPSVFEVIMHQGDSLHIYSDKEVVELQTIIADVTLETDEDTGEDFIGVTICSSDMGTGIGYKIPDKYLDNGETLMRFIGNLTLTLRTHPEVANLDVQGDYVEEWACSNLIKCSELSY